MEKILNIPNETPSTSIKLVNFNNFSFYNSDYVASTHVETAVPTTTDDKIEENISKNKKSVSFVDLPSSTFAGKPQATNKLKLNPLNNQNNQNYHKRSSSPLRKVL